MRPRTIRPSEINWLHYPHSIMPTDPVPLMHAPTSDELLLFVKMRDRGPSQVAVLWTHNEETSMLLELA